MTSEYIEKVIECESNRIRTTDTDSSIADGAMGVALFMIWYGQEYNKDKYIKDGLNIIESRCLHLYSNEPLDFHKGQVGIAMGILWLSSSKIISNQITVLLRQVDDNIFKNVTSRLYQVEQKHIGALIDIAFYLSLRLKHNSFEVFDTQIYSKLLSKIINLVYPGFYKVLTQEVYPGGYSYILPRFITLLACSFGNNFDSRIVRIIEELQPYVLAQIPYMVSNRIALSNSIYLLSQNMTLHYRWIKHAALLAQSIDAIDLEYEFKSNQMSLYNGMGWFAINLLISGKFCNTQNQLFNLVERKFKQSSLPYMTYNELVDRGFIGLYGILGFIFIYLKFKCR